MFTRLLLSSFSLPKILSSFSLWQTEGRKKQTHEHLSTFSHPFKKRHSWVACERSKQRRSVYTSSSSSALVSDFLHQPYYAPITPHNFWEYRKHILKKSHHLLDGGTYHTHHLLFRKISLSHITFFSRYAFYIPKNCGDDLGPANCSRRDGPASYLQPFDFMLKFVTVECNLVENILFYNVCTWNSIVYSLEIIRIRNLLNILILVYFANEHQL